MSQPNDRKSLHDLLEKLLDSTPSSDQQHRVMMIDSSLKADPLFQNPAMLLPMDEIAERHDHAKNIQKYVAEVDADFFLTALHVAVILTVPLSQLRRHGRLSIATQAPFGLRDALDDLAKLSYHYLTAYTDAQFAKDSAKSPSAPGRKGSLKRLRDEDGEDLDYIPSGKSRQKQTVKTALARDGNACIFLQTSNPAVAHIIPASWNLTQQQITKTKKFAQAMSTLINTRAKEAEWQKLVWPLLADSKKSGSSDRPWNTVCMNHQLHHWFDKGLCGLKYLGSQVITAKQSMSLADIQFHWMMHDGCDRARDMHVGKEDDMFMDLVSKVQKFTESKHPAPQLAGQSEGLVASLNVNTGVPLVSGRVVRIEVLTEDVPRLQAVLDIQWACLKIASMAGSAGWPDFYFWDSDDDEDIWRMSIDNEDEGTQRMKVEEWVSEQSELVRQIPGAQSLRTTTNRPPREESPSKTGQQEQARAQRQEPRAEGSENIRPHGR